MKHPNHTDPACGAHQAQPLVELRRYTLHKGGRETLIGLFDTVLTESMERSGIEMIGQFRDADDPTAFVLIRGFPSLAAREAAFDRFYSDEPWRRVATAAKAAIADYSNSILLRPASAASNFSILPPTDSSAAADTAPECLVVVTTHQMHRDDTGEFTDLFERELLPQLRLFGAEPLAQLVTETMASPLLRYPVRDAGSAFVSITSFDNQAAYARYIDELQTSSAWRNGIGHRVSQFQLCPPEVWRLLPTTAPRTGRALCCPTGVTFTDRNQDTRG